ncbi:TetR/AcrR family transcriptional regulator [Streptomyces sp. NBC_01497]|uniref:TetR/AcrR family transcriptional regulator n=1 Tax=Streptomyces sp. NBC_01497 TaxID=2903885 RepID=UPI002E343055|nr:TetR/AcrR family transcriptional regulator [Streptomyces sp. NBC_01497]
MPSITRSPSDSEENRAKVESAVFEAVKNLLDSGMKYTEISVQKIIVEAQIARSTFYSHFRDKSDLLSRLGRSLSKSFFEEATSDALDVWDAVESPDGLQGITKLLEGSIARHRRHFSVLSAISETAAYDSSVHNFYTTDLEEFEKRVVSDLRRRQEEGMTDSRVDPIVAGRIIVWGGEQAIAHHISKVDQSGDAAFALELASIWWYGAYNRRLS